MAAEDMTADCCVLVNAEGQYSIWPGGKAPPVGWTPDGFRGARAACVAHVDEVWTDMRPRSLVARRDAASPTERG